jgi:hypothetical protein
VDALIQLLRQALELLLVVHELDQELGETLELVGTEQRRGLSRGSTPKMSRAWPLKAVWISLKGGMK